MTPAELKQAAMEFLAKVFKGDPDNPVHAPDAVVQAAVTVVTSPTLGTP